MFHTTSNVAGLVTKNGLVCINDCICPHQSVTYECSVIGGQFTVWRGSALGDHCEIILNHIQINVSKSIACNNQTIAVQLSRQDNCYTSHLTFNVSSNHNGQTIECYIHEGTHDTLVNTSILQVPSNGRPNTLGVS